MAGLVVRQPFRTLGRGPRVVSSLAPAAAATATAPAAPAPPASLARLVVADAGSLVVRPHVPRARVVRPHVTQPRLLPIGRFVSGRLAALFASVVERGRLGGLAGGCRSPAAEPEIVVVAVAPPPFRGRSTLHRGGFGRRPLLLAAGGGCGCRPRSRRLEAQR